MSRPVVAADGCLSLRREAHVPKGARTEATAGVGAMW